MPPAMKRHPKTLRSRLPRPHLVAWAATLSLGLPAWAQSTAPQAVIVTGQAVSTDRALRDQAAADTITSVVRADGIGQLPDKNTAEALQRLPGVSVERDQGEGRYVRIRGLGPDLNTVTLNGSLVPAPERDRRAVMLDVLPSSLVRSLVVSKTLTPDQDANSLGGTVDVRSFSAFDQPGRFLALDAGLGHETNTGRRSPNGALAWSDRMLGGTLGVAIGLSYEQRKFGSDNVETGGAWDGDALEEFERRDYRITRERQGLALNLEYRPREGTQAWLRLVHARFSDDEQRQKHAIEFDEPQAEGERGEAESVRELKARKEVQTIDTLVLGGVHRFGPWRLEAALGSSRAVERTPQHIATAAFEAEDSFENAGYSDRSRPQLAAPASMLDAAPYALKEIELEQTRVADREHNLRLDLGRSLAWGTGAVDLKFGAKASRRSKTSEQTTWVLEDFDGPSALAGYSTGAVDYAWGRFGPAISSAALRPLVDAADLDDALDDEESTVNDFRIDERIDAAYVQAGFDLSGTRMLVGVRRESTRLDAAGTGLDDDGFRSVRVQRRHSQWLPGVHLRHDLDARTAVRAAWTNSVVRPTFGQLAPGFVIDGDEASFGNPDLKPLRSSNLDLGIERGLGYAGVVSGYVFHKRIRDFIYQTDLAGTGAWTDFDEAVTFVNGGRASVSGIELAYSRSLRELPAPWNALVVGANATFSRSSATIGRLDPDSGTTATRRIALPSQSRRVVNAMIGWETPAWSVRLAANHKSDYLLEVTDVLDASRDLTVRAQTQVDLSARYSIDRRVAVVFEALNLTDQAYDVRTGRGSVRNAQYETYGRTYRLNLKLTLD